MTAATAPAADEVATGDTIGPRWVPGVLVVLATVIAVVSAMTTWVRTQALDTDEWVQVSSELLDDEQIRDALATYLTDELYDRIDLAGELESRLPDLLSPLAGPIAGALREPVTNGVERVLESERIATLWANANRLAHERLVLILRDETREGISTAGGTVTLDLGELIGGVVESLGLPDSITDRIPDDAGQIVIFESDELDTVQTTVQVLDFLSWFLFLVVVVLYALAVLLARGRRRQALRSVGIGLAVGGVALLLLRSVGVRLTVDWLVQDPDQQALAGVAANIATSALRQMAWTGVVLGVLILGFAVLLGPHRWAVSIRRFLAGWSASTGAVVATAVVVVVVLLWWSPGRAFDRWITAIVLIAMTIGAVVALATWVRREFPDAASPPPSDPDGIDAGGDTAGEAEAAAEVAAGPSDGGSSTG